LYTNKYCTAVHTTVATEPVVKGVISKAFYREMSCDDKSYNQNFAHPSKPSAVAFNARLSFTCEAVA